MASQLDQPNRACLSLAVWPPSLCYYYGPPPSTLFFSYYLPTLPTPHTNSLPYKKGTTYSHPILYLYQHF
ncbi:Non-histone chromosomal protein 6 [Penicillium bovifimosum]|uniref:Non-histone chromosomal protein 6 n=1 Tax=Penicillium bovifimosum TaxID=126998 RepID=A0A9W9H0X7_9EURO|nr:Non-histone chromosomal protein 6 [Penicillium bovifimosum]KAJ5135581.1 Non-histone chromosomal protein 6 [Penicillium bovifimosum]